MDRVTFDDLIDALLDDFDRKWRKLQDMTERQHPAKAEELCRLDAIRSVSCLLIGARHGRDRPGAFSVER